MGGMLVGAPHGGYACGGPPWWVMIGERADAEIDSDMRGDNQRFGRGNCGIPQAFEVSSCKAYKQLSPGGRVVLAQECRDILEKCKSLHIPNYCSAVPGKQLPIA